MDHALAESFGPFQDPLDAPIGPILHALPSGRIRVVLAFDHERSVAVTAVAFDELPLDLLKRSVLEQLVAVPGCS
jgi:hypothetical protein